MGERIKRAWVDEKNRILAFHPISNSVMQVKAEEEFWSWVMVLTRSGYRLM